MSSSVAVAEDAKYVRWTKESMPLKVYIEKTSNVSGFKNTFPVYAAKAFRQWKVDTRELVDFVIVNNKNDADIIVSWADKLRKEDIMETARGHGFVWGVTKIGNPTQIILVTKHPLNDNHPLSENVLYMIALHEIGHSLGLWWHTTDTKDIMYPDFIVPSTTANGSRLIANHNKGTLSRRDIQNLMALYNNNNVITLDKVARGSNIKMPAFNNSLVGNIETTGTAAASVATTTPKLNVNLGEALQQLKNDPNSYEAYNNIGLVYLENEDYSSAVTSFQKALNLNPYYPKARFNLALTFVKSKKYDQAILEYEKYLELEPDSINSENVKKEIERLKMISTTY
jgi:predicted Zn-dependent protease